MPKVLPPAFSAGNDAGQWLIFVGGTTTTPLGQVKTFSWSQEIDADEQTRISDSKAYYTDKSVKVTGPLELWASTTVAEETSVGGVVLTTEDTPKTLIAVYHSAEATSGAVVKTYTFTEFRITKIDAGPREGQSSTYSAYTWRATLMTPT